MINANVGMTNSFMKSDQLLVQGVPEKIKRDFKSACAKRNMTMKKALILFMKLFPKNGFANLGGSQDNRVATEKVGVK